MSNQPGPGARMTVTFSNSAANNEPVELVVSGNWADRYATVTMGEVPVAQATRVISSNERQMPGISNTVRLGCPRLSYFFWVLLRGRWAEAFGDGS
jgi:hypothetical protein